MAKLWPTQYTRALYRRLFDGVSNGEGATGPEEGGADTQRTVGSASDVAVGAASVGGALPAGAGFGGDGATVLAEQLTAVPKLTMTSARIMGERFGK